MQRKNTFVYSFIGLLALLVLAGAAGAAYASLPTGSSAILQNIPASSAIKGTNKDGLDSLPLGLQGVSYSTLAASGKVHPVAGAPSLPSDWKNPYTPALNITWGPDKLTGAGSGEPAAGINPSNFLYALISGNFNMDHTTDGGVTWTSAAPPNPHNSGDVVNAWLESAPGNALELSINQSGGYDYTCARTSDFGVTWATDAACGPSVSTPYFDDREYIWVDRSPSSPFHGRVYVTTALFDAGGSGSFNTVSNRWSSDNGVSWNPPSSAPLALVPNNEFATGVAHNEYPSMGISSDGTIGYAWRRGLCCGGSPTVGTNDKIMFARSTDGGVSFPYSTTVVTVPLNQSIVFNSTSPFGQRWSDTPNIAADPSTNGTFYAIWTQYRTANSAASSAVYLSKTTDNGTTWSTPVIPYNNPNGSIFQGFGWVKVTADHTVHVTYLGGTSSNTTAGQFYVQSTDGGATFTAPFQLNAANITTFASTTDYEADDVTLSAGPGAIIAGWDDQTGHHARIGLYTAGTATPTPTGTLPTSTPTNTPTLTPTATATVCGGTSPYATSTIAGATIVPGTTDVGNACDDCSTTITLPFPFRLYDQTYTSADVTSNGQLDLLTTDTGYLNACLPDATASYAIFPYWDDQRTDSAGLGIFTSITGSAPNRIFNIEWRTNYFSGGGSANYEVRLYEGTGQSQFDIIYGTLAQGNTSATSGVQRDTGSVFQQYFCNGAGGAATGGIHYQQPTCGSPVPTNTAASTFTATATTGSGSPTATATCAPSLGSWAAGPDLPSPLTRPVGVYFPTDGNFYLMGGRTSDAAGSDQLNPLEYNTSTNTWSTKAAAYNDAQVNNQACGVLTQGGTPYIFCVGGSAAGNTTASAQVRQYNPATDTLTALTAADNWPGNSTGDILPGGFAVANNKLYILGGFQINVASTNQIWEFDPNAAVGSRWTQKVNTPVGIMYAPTTAIGGIIYVGGASDYDGTTVLDTDTSFSYNPATNTIGTIATIPRATGETRGVVVDGQMWVLGGGRTAPNPSNEVDVYDPATNTWSIGPAFTNVRRNPGADSDPATGRVWMAGGYDSSGTTLISSFEIYTPGVACGTPVATSTATNSPVATVTTVATNSPVATVTTVGTDTPVATDTAVTTTTGTPATETSTSVATVTGTPPTATETPTVCTLSFEDVPSGSTFYVYIQCLACRGIINGYPCGGPLEPCNANNDPYFRPQNNVTRGQFAKIASLAAGFNEPAGGLQYTDVPIGSTYYDYIWRLTNRGLVNGYPCGGVGEPCDGGNRPYFRPNANVTRGQLSKIDSNAAGFNDTPTGQQYEDVQVGSTFYDFIYRLSSRGIIAGYPCGGVSEPCGPGNLPYFRPNANATRGQASKIVANTFFPECSALQAPALKQSVNQ